MNTPTALLVWFLTQFGAPALPFCEQVLRIDPATCQTMAPPPPEESEGVDKAPTVAAKPRSSVDPDASGRISNGF